MPRRTIRKPHDRRAAFPPIEQRGFTLLEMLAAIALLSMTLLAVAGGIGAALRTLMPSADAVQAAEIAHAKLDSLCLDIGGTSEHSQGREGRARWQLDVAPSTRTASVQLVDGTLHITIGTRHYRFSTVCAVNAL